MDERFNKVIKKMEKLFNKSSDLWNRIREEFSGIEKTQRTIDNKIKGMRDEYDQLIETIRNESGTLYDEIKHHFEGKDVEINSKIENIEEKSNDVINQHKNKVDELIDSINKKSTKILKLYDELEKLQETQKNAERYFNEIKEKSAALELKINERMKSMVSKEEMNDYINKTKELINRVDELEKKSHTHIFGGKKA